MTPSLGVHLDPPLSGIPGRINALGWNVFQTYLRDPRRLASVDVPDAEDRAGFTGSRGSLFGIAHASMLTSLGSADPRVRNGSAGALAADANLTADLGMQGVCFHVGYEKGHPDRATAHAAVARKLSEVLARLRPGARVLLENGAEGTELGQTVDEIADVLDIVGRDAERIGIVLDTCHLHVSGTDMADVDAPARLADALDRRNALNLLTAIHLNDARFPCGSRRDRHAAPGEGTIGAGLRRLLDHPAFATTPAIMEVDTEAAVRGAAFLLDGGAA